MHHSSYTFADRADPGLKRRCLESSRSRRRKCTFWCSIIQGVATPRKLAEQVAEGIRSVAGVDAVLKSTQEVTKEDFTGAAGIVAGSPVYFGVMAADLKRIFDEFVGIRSKIENKVGAAFASSAFWAEATRRQSCPFCSACSFTA